jgi:hypothetical protein
LRVWRENDKNGKTIKMNAGMQNQFIDDHEKNNLITNPLVSNTKTNSDIDVRLKEEFDIMNKLYKKII